MTTHEKAFANMLQSYARATNSSDSIAYASLFFRDAIRMPPGSNPEYGPKEIQKSEQTDYDVADWSVRFTPRDVLPIGNDWLYGIADVDVVTVAHADGLISKIQLTATWLLHKQDSGEWRIKRQMWNRSSDGL